MSLFDQANDVIDRLEALNTTVANACAFRALLEDLHKPERDLSLVKEPHIQAIKMVRAGILRALIGTVMACLDRQDRRGNRASVGQILELLKDQGVLSTLSKSTQAGATIQQIDRDYSALVKGRLYSEAWQLRTDLISHVLIKPGGLPEVPYKSIYDLHDAAMRLAVDLFQVGCRPKPEFMDHTASLSKHAKIFWDTYFAGMQSQ